MSELKTVVKSLNEYLEKIQKPTLTMKDDLEELTRDFLQVITYSIEDESAGNLPSDVIDYYNNQYATEEPEPEEIPEESKVEEVPETSNETVKVPEVKEEETPKEVVETSDVKEVKPKKKKKKKTTKSASSDDPTVIPKKKKDPKAPKVRREPGYEKDIYGYRVGTGANKINMYLSTGEGKTIPELIELVGTTRSRVTSHFGSLRSKNYFLDNINGKYILLKEEPEGWKDIKKKKRKTRKIPDEVLKKEMQSTED